MAEGEGGDAAVVSFDDLLRLVRDATQRVREHLSPAGTPRTWLGPSALLAEAIAGSVLRCESLEEGSFIAVIPPRAHSTAPVRRVRNVVSVRVSRDGSLATAKYEELQSLHHIVKGIVPGVLTMGSARGQLADTVRSLETGEPVTISVAAPQPPARRPLFTVLNSQKAVLGTSPDFMGLLFNLSVQEVPWDQFTQAEWWGLPPVTVTPCVVPIQWNHDADALGIAAIFELPPVSSNIDALHFVIGCCEPPPLLTSVGELSYGFADSAPTAAREAVTSLLSRLPAATQSRPEIVDSVHSRLKAISQSPDAPVPFVAYGTAWRQGALEPQSSHRPSRSASPSAHPPRRTTAVFSPPSTPTRVLADVIDAMSPNSMRQKLRELLTVQPTPAAAGPSSISGAVAPAMDESPRGATPIERRSTGSRPQHSGQLGGLFTRQPTITPALTTAPAQPRPAFITGAPPAPAPAPALSRLSAPTIGSVLQTISPENGEAIATAVVIPAAYHHLPVTEAVTALASHGMSDVVTQFAHAAGDTMPVTAGSVYEAISLLRHIEEVFADVSEAVPSFTFLERQPAGDWKEATEAVQILLGAHSAAFRSKRQRATATTTTVPVSQSPVEEKPPVGCYKQVPTASTTERPGACDAQLLEDMASTTALRREHVRSSPFYSSASSEAERDSALAGELAYFCTTYGQAATAYVLSNGTSQTALSGYGVPMALAAIRSHLLARVTSLVNSTVGLERALLSLHTKCGALATGFLTGLVDVDDCVALLGGSAPHEDAEIRREGGAVSTGTLGSTSGANAQLSIREAFTLWGQGLHMVLGSIPGISTAGTDFAVCSQLKKIPRDLDDAKLLSICRFMTSRVGIILSAHRTIRGAPLPDVCEIVTKATTTVFQERDLDQRSEERAVAVTAPLLARIQQLEAAQTKGRYQAKQNPTTAAVTEGNKPRSKYAGTTPHKNPARAQAGRSEAHPNKPGAAKSGAAPAHEAAQQFLASLQSTSPEANTPQPLWTSPTPPHEASQSPSEGRITSRLKALVELSALYRQHVGMDPKGDPAQEPCAYRALFGKCGQDDCVRCTTDKTFPQHLVDAVRSRCDPKVLNKNKSSGKSGGQSKGGQNVKQQPNK